MLIVIAGSIAMRQPSPATFRQMHKPYTSGLFEKSVITITMVVAIMSSTVNIIGFILKLSRELATKTFSVAESSAPDEPISVRVESDRFFLNPIILYVF
jgi:hypothetical protein